MKLKNIVIESNSSHKHIIWSMQNSVQVYTILPIINRNAF